MAAPSTAPHADKPGNSVMRVLVKVLKWMFYLFLCLFGLAVFGFWPIEIGWYLAFGWIHFIGNNLAAVKLNPVLLTEGIACTAALGVGAHYFCRWLYREAGASTERAWRWQWTASMLAVVMLLFVAGIGTIGAVHQAAWLFNAKDPLLESSWGTGRARVSEAILAGSAGRSVVQDYYQSNGRLPQNGAEAGYPRETESGSRLVSAVEIRDKGVVVVTLNKDRDWPDGGEITLAPTEDAAARTLSWKCRSTLPQKLLPGSCRD